MWGLSGGWRTAARYARYSSSITVTIGKSVRRVRPPRSRDVGQWRPFVQFGANCRKERKTDIPYSSHGRERSTRFAGTQPVDPLLTVIQYCC